MKQEAIINELQEFKAQALGMVNWAEKMLDKYGNPTKKKGLSEAEINKALNKRRKIRTSKP